MGKIRIKRVLVTSLMVTLAIGGIFWFTWKTGQVFVRLISASPADVQVDIEETSVPAILDLPEVTVWICQVGVYKDEHNASRAIESLQEKGLTARLIQQNPNIIALAAFPTKEQAVRQSKALAEQRVEVWVREEKYPALHYRVSGNNVEKITCLLEQTNSILNGKSPEVVANEANIDLNAYSSQKYPNNFDNLKNKLYNVLNTNNGMKIEKYGQDFLDLYLEYRQTTKKYFPDTQ